MCGSELKCADLNWNVRLWIKMCRLWIRICRPWIKMSSSESKCAGSELKLLELDIWQSSCCGSLNSSEFNFFAGWRWYRTLLIHFLRTSIIPKCVWDIENLMIHTKEFYPLPISQTLPHKLYPREEVETQLGFIAAIFLWILHSISFHGHNITISPSQKH